VWIWEWNYLADGTCGDDALSIVIPDYRNLWGFDLMQYQIHARFILLDTVTGYRSQYQSCSTIIKAQRLLSFFRWSLTRYPTPKPPPSGRWLSRSAPEHLATARAFFCGVARRRRTPYHPPAPPGDGGKNSPARLTPSPFCRRSAPPNPDSN